MGGLYGLFGVLESRKSGDPESRNPLRSFQATLLGMHQQAAAVAVNGRQRLTHGSHFHGRKMHPKNETL